MLQTIYRAVVVAKLTYPSRWIGFSSANNRQKISFYSTQQTHWLLLKSTWRLQ